ncbi:hypothetical protein AAHA92_30657 [Salvia divinorum]|uniref:Transmembrane protein n=1 Tax=Salvia divinorum TaxID=28513 RepID=A0ABD1FS49_SALDI
MAAHSNRSLSPLSSRPIHPNPRNPETNSTIRRSFTATNNKPSLLPNQRRLDPFTPANIPSDFGGRRCVGRDCEEKENDEKDCILKGSKLQSPVKGCKNFMSPTISAASKFTPSPRKKVLVDRNEPVRTSISFSDGKAMFFSDENMPVSENKKGSVVETHPVSKPCKKVTFSESLSDSQHSAESVITDSDGLGVESKVVQSPIGPLVADPCLPPYDPKTNYLSPRPQFIRYKPNPRIEMLLNKEKGMDSDEFEYSLMAEMMSEGFSDSDEASADMVIGLDEEIGAADHVSEPPSFALPVITAPIDEILEEEFVGSDGKKPIDHVYEPPSLPIPVSTVPVDKILEKELVGSDGKKPRRLARLMCFSMVLVLLVAAAVSVSVARVPSFDESLLFIKDLSISDLSSSSSYEQSRAAVASARLSLGHVAASSAALVFKLANELVEGEKQAPVQLMNLSDLQENAWKEAYFLKRVENVEEDEFEEELDSAMEDEAYDEEIDLEAEIDAFDWDDYIEKETDETTAETASDTVIQTEMDQSLNQETDVKTATEVAIETSPDSAHLESESSQNIQIQTGMDQSSADPQIQETEVEAAMEMEKSQVDMNVGVSDNAETESSVITLAITCLLAGVVGVAALVYNRVPGSSSNVAQVEPVVPVESKQLDDGVTKSSNTEAMEQEEEYHSESWQTEMSCSYHERSGGGGEVESSERRYSKRESLASSSGSPSYGSFTTYERIPIKANGYGEEEIMTPVRRSSRIRKKVT